MAENLVIFILPYLLSHGKDGSDFNGNQKSGEGKRGNMIKNKAVSERFQIMADLFGIKNQIGFSEEELDQCGQSI